MKLVSDSRIKILHILPSLESGGIESVIYDYYRYFDKTQFEFSFITHTVGGNIYDKLIDLDCSVIYVPPKRKNFLTYCIKMFIALKKTSFEILHVHQGHMSFFPLILSCFFRKKVRIAHIHWIGVEESSVKKYLNSILSFFITKISNYHFACSLDAANYLFTKKLISNNKVIFMKNALELTSFVRSDVDSLKLKNELGIGNELVLALVGRFTLEKNHLFALSLIENLKTITSVKVLFIGDGPLRNSIENKAKEMNLLDNILFLGNRNDVSSLLNIVDVLIQPSIYEGLGRAIIEAQAMGIFSVVSNRVPREVNLFGLVYFLDIETGVKEWSEKILEFSRKNPLQRIDLIRKNGYDIQMEAHKIMKLYNTMIYGRKR